MNDAPRMTYPKWMNDALASDLAQIIEAREAEARAAQKTQRMRLTLAFKMIEQQMAEAWLNVVRGRLHP